MRFLGSSTWSSLFAITLPALVGACAGRPSNTEATVAKVSPVVESGTIVPLEPIVELPRSPLGQLARSLVDVINGGNTAEQREFVRTRFSEKVLKETSFEDWVTFLGQTWKSSGGIDVVGVPPARRPNAMRFEVRTRRGRHYSTFAILTDASSESSHIDAFLANPKPDPSVIRAGALTPVPMSEVEAARAITRRAEQLAAADIFSGTVLVLKRDRVLVSTAHGHADKSFGVPNRIDTKFNLGSMNKMFTAIAVGQLVEKGKLSFSDKLGKVLPDYPNRAFAESVTIHQLLTHTSGIGGNIFAPEVLEHRDRYKRPSDYLPLFAKDPAEFPPGERFSYANPGFIVLGVILERLSGENYDDYVRAHLFEPAKMHDTGSFGIDEVVPNRAVGYRIDDADAFGVLPRRTNVMSGFTTGTPAGGGYATAPDLGAFASALRGHKLLGAVLTETVTSAKVDNMPGPLAGRRYGYGFMSHVVRGKEVRGHGGGAAGINSSLQIFWDGSYTVAVMGNYDPPVAERLADEIVEFLAVQGEKEPSAKP
jgi:CubicO group peptidase (beta-lactamase class C family)